MFFKELQVATFSTASPTRTFTHNSSALLLFLPQTRHPATGLEGLGGWKGSRQPSCGLCSARCGDLSKWPRNPSPPQPSRRAGCGAGCPAAALPAPPPARSLLPAPPALPGKGREKPKRLLLGEGGKKIPKLGSPLLLHRLWHPFRRGWRGAERREPRKGPFRGAEARGGRGVGLGRALEGPSRRRG